MAQVVTKVELSDPKYKEEVEALIGGGNNQVVNNKLRPLHKISAPKGDIVPNLDNRLDSEVEVKVQKKKDLAMLHRQESNPFDEIHD